MQVHISWKWYFVRKWDIPCPHLLLILVAWSVSIITFITCANQDVHHAIHSSGLIPLISSFLRSLLYIYVLEQLLYLAVNSKRTNKKNLTIIPYCKNMWKKLCKVKLGYLGKLFFCCYRLLERLATSLLSLKVKYKIHLF